MFNSKKTALIEQKQTASVSSATMVATENKFLKGARKKSFVTQSGNGALKYTSTDNQFVDQFGKLGVYKQPRTYDDIARDMATLWAINPMLTVSFVFFIRLITRVVQLFSGSKTTVVQRGSGLRHEGIMRMMWIHVNHKDTFWKNIHLFISAGSWKDIFVMMSFDLQYNGWEGRILDWEKLGKLVMAGLENPKSSNLVKKYLPQIKSNSQCKTLAAQADNIIAKYICSRIFATKKENESSTYKQYRKLKTSGNAHTWQQLISQKKLLELNFDTVHGRALAQMVSGKFLANNGLEKRYEEWIASKPVAKFTGYVYELFKKDLSKLKTYQIATINSQFNGLVETARKNAKTSTGLIVVRDTSGSMMSDGTGTGVSNFDIAKSLALFFSAMLDKGAFANSYIEFNRSAKLIQWRGTTPCEKWAADRQECVGNTNFQSVIDLFCDMRKDKNIPETDFPTGILCVSDGEFDVASLKKTNVRVALNKLKTHGFSEEYVSNFRIILWNLPSSSYANTAGRKFETDDAGVKNVFYFSGFDGSIVSFLTGVEGKEETKATPSTAEELFKAAMEQEMMSFIEL